MQGINFSDLIGCPWITKLIQAPLMANIILYQFVLNDILEKPTVTYKNTSKHQKKRKKNCYKRYVFSYISDNMKSIMEATLKLHKEYQAANQFIQEQSRKEAGCS